MPFIISFSISKCPSLYQNKTPFVPLPYPLALWLFFPTATALLAEESVDGMLGAIGDGWKPEKDWCGAEARELLSCMSWVGRQCAGRLVKLMIKQQDPNRV